MRDDPKVEMGRSVRSRRRRNDQDGNFVVDRGARGAGEAAPGGFGRGVRGHDEDRAVTRGARAGPLDPLVDRTLHLAPLAGQVDGEGAARHSGLLDPERRFDGGLAA